MATRSRRTPLQTAITAMKPATVWWFEIFVMGRRIFDNHLLCYSEPFRFHTVMVPAIARRLLL